MSKTPENFENCSNEFKNRILNIIDDLELNYNEFADFVNVSLPIVNRAAKYGIYPTTKILTRIANKLEVPILYLLGKSDDATFNLSDGFTTYNNRIFELINEKKINFGQLAIKMPFPKEYFYEWQRRKSVPSIDFAIAIAEYFDVSVDYLLGRSDDRQN